METTGVAGNAAVAASETKTGFGSLTTDDFLQLLIAELQNQDPTKPMENSELVAQLNQIYELHANKDLTDSLEAVTLGQNMATATTLLGREIVGLNEDAEFVTGRVDRITVEEGVTKLHVGDHTVTLENVSEVYTATAE